MSFRIIPSIYLKDGKVVNKNTMEIVGDGDAVALATLYNNRGADELIIFDISETDSQHDNNIGTMVSIADAVDIPILVGGNIKRLEDVKKYIYTGAKKAILDGNKESNLELVSEASERFGSDKIAVMIDSTFDMNKIKTLKYDGASLIIANNCAREALGYGIRVLAYDCMYSFEDIISFAKEEKVYGVSHAGLDEAFDYMNFKAQLKDEDVKVDVLEQRLHLTNLRLIVME